MTDSKMRIWGKEFDREKLVGTVYRLQRITDMRVCSLKFWSPNDWIQLNLLYSPNKKDKERLKVQIQLVNAKNTPNTFWEGPLDHKLFQQNDQVIFGIFEKIKELLILELKDLLPFPEYWYLSDCSPTKPELRF